MRVNVMWQKNPLCHVLIGDLKLFSFTNRHKLLNTWTLNIIRINFPGVTYYE